ncbi:conserved hypothetical protein [Talaromyces stipitatus ATCC 10500]|uniref:Cytoskeleton-associated protein n=1 Tax=Talaromyces stipitatus (strain ATCC 10500 / CBS 375.48 / QM 6759 / NRRL 1006) TaxID=441959 RepID=B8MHP0_TALSN|nr:uncharacterized protein TSTA_011300 [Talaromyces stipitatus ATCC 10500]EED16021.1 conserved hypothetical protein [Talaromyces stipitatus ATCC 10500]
MALRSDNSILWLVLGLSLGFVAARRIIHDLYEIRTLTEITRPENDERMISKGTEDALKLETLQKLSESPSYELRGASLRIISERATKEPSWDLLLEDLAGKNKRRRNRAVNAIHFLFASRALSRVTLSPRLNDFSTYKAIVDCLCNFLEEHNVEYTTTESPILPRTRPPGEKKLLATLNILLVQNIPAALEAGVVSRWLSKYPFPCLRESTTTTTHGNDYRRKDVVWLMKMYWPDDTFMSSIITTLVGTREGIRQLRKYGLMGSVMEEGKDMDDHDDGGDDEDSDVWMINGESTAGTSWVPERLSFPEESYEEQVLRRRRREAMVFSEDGGPIRSDNIIQLPI